MKKVILLSLVLIFLTVGCARYPSDFTEPYDTEFLSLITELDTPEKIGEYMLDNFEYEAHDFTTQTPYELYLSGKGDCDEFSAFGVFMANYHNITTYQVQIFDKTPYSHFVAIYDETICYSITDNRNYYFGFNDFLEIVEHVCNIRDKVWTTYKVYDYNMNIVETGEKE